MSVADITMDPWPAVRISLTDARALRYLFTDASGIATKGVGERPRQQSIVPFGRRNFGPTSIEIDETSGNSSKTGTRC